MARLSSCHERRLVARYVYKRYYATWNSTGCT